VPSVSAAEVIDQQVQQGKPLYQSEGLMAVCVDEGIISPEMWLLLSSQLSGFDIKATLGDRIEEIMRNLTSEEANEGYCGSKRTFNRI
jgi:hypothetical protein